MKKQIILGMFVWSVFQPHVLASEEGSDVKSDSGFGQQRHGSVLSMVLPQPNHRDPNSTAMVLQSSQVLRSVVAAIDDISVTEQQKAVLSVRDLVSEISKIAELARVAVSSIGNFSGDVRSFKNPVSEFLSKSWFEIGLPEEGTEKFDAASWVRSLSTQPSNETYVDIGSGRFTPIQLAENVYVDSRPDKIHTYTCKCYNVVAHKNLVSCCNEYTQWVRRRLMHVAELAARHSRSHAKYVQGVREWNRRMEETYKKFSLIVRQYPTLRIRSYPLFDPKSDYNEFVLEQWLPTLSTQNNTAAIIVLSDKNLPPDCLATQAAIETDVGFCPKSGMPCNHSDCGAQIKSIKVHMFKVAISLVQNLKKHNEYIIQARNFESNVLSVMNSFFQSLASCQLVPNSDYEKALRAAETAKGTLNRIVVSCDGKVAMASGDMEGLEDVNEKSNRTLRNVGLAFVSTVKDQEALTEKLVDREKRVEQLTLDIQNLKEERKREIEEEKVSTKEKISKKEDELKKLREKFDELQTNFRDLQAKEQAEKLLADERRENNPLLFTAYQIVKRNSLPNCQVDFETFSRKKPIDIALQLEEVFEQLRQPVQMLQSQSECLSARPVKKGAE